MSDPNPFRTAALALLVLPIEERTAAFCRLLDEWMPIEITAANGDAWAMVNRTTAMWAIGAEIGVMSPPMLE